MSLKLDDMKKSARKLFPYLAENPGTWVLSAERLKKAADVLRESAWPQDRGCHNDQAATADFMIGPVYMMLMGFAIENLLKAMAIAQNPKCVEEQKLSEHISTHDLSNLWRSIGLRRCREYDRNLKRLETSFIVSFGRYPVTTLKRDMDSMLSAGFHGEADFSAMDRLWNSLQREFKKLCPDVPFDE